MPEASCPQDARPVVQRCASKSLLLTDHVGEAHFVVRLKPFVHVSERLTDHLFPRSRHLAFPEEMNGLREELRVAPCPPPLLLEVSLRPWGVRIKRRTFSLDQEPPVAREVHYTGSPFLFS